MKRPAWAAAPKFSECWSACEMGISKWPKNSTPSSNYSLILSGLQGSRVVAVAPDQVNALPRLIGHDLSDLPTAVQGLRLPFDPVFLDLGGVSLEPWVNNGIVAGGLCTESWPDAPGEVTVIPFLGNRGSGIPCAPGGFVAPHESRTAVQVRDIFEERDIRQRLTPAQLEDSRMSTVDAAERAYAVLAWLQSYNVELAEAPLSPRQINREKEKGRLIALTVRVKQSKRYRADSEANGKANYSHRFETRGHYKHFFELKVDGTPSKTFERCYAKDSSRVVTIDGKPCFRFWVPPFVKGPSDKPFVPKVRTTQ